MKRQMESVIYVTDDFATEPAARLAHRLAELTPGGPRKKVFFSQSGAAAIEAAIKAARMFKFNELLSKGVNAFDAPGQYPFPYKIISRYKSWHGASAMSSSASGDPRRWFLEPLTAPGVVFAPEANAYRPLFPGEDPVQANLDYLDYIIENEGGSNKVAAFLIEPVVGSNGIIPPPPGYLDGIQALCRKWNLLLIADETMSGMGRTGKFLALEHFGLEPDVIVMGKALGVYCPLAATIFSERVSSAFEEAIFGHGQSYSGHALGCAAALASIEVLFDDGLLEQAKETGNYLKGQLESLKERHPSVGDVRGLGLFWTLELVRNRTSHQPLRKTTEKYSPTILQEIAEYLLHERNVYVPADKFGIWIVPPLVVTRSEIDFLVDAIEDALYIAERKGSVD